MSWLSGPGLDADGRLTPRPAADSAFRVRQLRPRAERSNAALHCKGSVQRSPRGNLRFPEVRATTAATRKHSSSEPVSSRLACGLGAFGEQFGERFFQAILGAAEEFG